ncbi:hypothetical protein VNI00_001122 [Paramarasmius palmivorus]|uniref:XPG-I domain-containing protein n=1 Tax=Paramarasmius palmivorus TaxID=297713 RepID=A0AAW0E6L8_9AGAR
MGVAGLWPLLQPAQSITTLTALSLTKFNGPHRGFRIGIDASIWFFHAEYGKEGENPELRTLFFRCAELTNHGFLPIFVFDGPLRPKFKRGKRVNTTQQHALVTGMQAIIEAFGFEYRTAPGEAEAELALLNRLGVIDGILSDDVDTFLFGATTVIRNHSSTHPSSAGSGSVEKSTVIVYNLPHPAFPDLQPADLIFIALCSGGDYDATGIPSCGIKIAYGLAQAGFGKSLYQAATTYGHDRVSMETFLRKWRADVAQELRTNASGYLPMKKPSVANNIPNTFPDIDVLLSYVTPITSESKGRLDRYDNLMVGHGRNDGWVQKDPSLPKIARLCEQYFEWGIMDSIIKRFRTVIFHGAVLRILRRTVLVEDQDAHNGLPPVSHDLLKKYFAPNYFVDLTADGEPCPVLVNKIHSTRQHASTSNTLEYRLEVSPTVLVKLTASGVVGDRRPPDEDEWAEEVEDDESDEEEGSKKKKKKAEPKDPKEPLRLWIPEAFIKNAIPHILEEYEEAQRKKAEKKAGKGKKQATGEKSPAKGRKGKSKDTVSAEVPSSPVKKKSTKENVKVATKAPPKATKPKQDARSRAIAMFEGQDVTDSDSEQEMESWKPSTLRSMMPQKDYLSKRRSNIPWEDETMDAGVLDNEKPPAKEPTKPLVKDLTQPKPIVKDLTQPKLLVKDLTKGRGTKVDQNKAANAKPKTAPLTSTRLSQSDGIDNIFSTRKPGTIAPVEKGKGKAKAAASAAAAYPWLTRDLYDDDTDESISLPSASTIFDGYASKGNPSASSSTSDLTTPRKTQPFPAPSPPRDDPFIDDFYAEAGPPDTPSPTKTNARKKSDLSSSSSEEELDGSPARSRTRELNKSPRKSKKQSSPRKSTEAEVGRKTIADVQHPSRVSRRSSSPTPSSRSSTVKTNTKMIAKSKRALPVINISSSDDDSEDDGTGTGYISRMAMTATVVNPNVRNTTKPKPQPKCIAVIDLT